MYNTYYAVLMFGEDLLTTFPKDLKTFVVYKESPTILEAKKRVGMLDLRQKAGPLAGSPRCQTKPAGGFNGLYCKAKSLWKRILLFEEEY